MKLNEITQEQVKTQLRLDEDIDIDVQPYMDAARSYIRSYTGLDDETVDSIDDLWLPYMVLCAEAFENRIESETRNRNVSPNVNRLLEQVLSMHAINYLGSCPADDE